MVVHADNGQISKSKLPGGRDYLSFSAVSLYQMCPLRFYFKYVLGLPEESVASSLVFGDAFHSALQFHFEQLLVSDKAPNLDALLSVFWDAWKRRDRMVRFCKGEDLNSIGKLADRTLKAFQQSQLATPNGTIIGIEEELRGVVVPGCPDFTARLDLLIDTGSELHLTDFKTSRSAWGISKVEDSETQLLLYHELTKEIANGRPIRLKFAVMTKAKFPTLTFHEVAPTSARISRTKQIVEQVWQGISSGRFYPVPSPANCVRCPYREPCRKWTG